VVGGAIEDAGGAVGTLGAVAEVDVEPRTVVVVALFVVIAVLFTYPALGHFRTSVAGDSGDSFFNLWVMRAVQRALPHGWHALWNQPIYHPARNTLAYSDTLFPEALLHWVLRSLVGDATAFNLIYLSSWVASCWLTYRLARRFVAYWGAAFLAACAYTFAAVRLTQQVHFQLVVGGALLPGVLLLAFWMLDRPSPWRGAALGATLAGLTLTASYLGPLTVLLVVVMCAVWPWIHNDTPRRPLAMSIGAMIGVAGVIVGPFALKYATLEHSKDFRRRFQPARATHLGDFLAAGSRSYLIRHVPFLSSIGGPDRNVEHRMFPGFVALTLGVVGVVVAVRMLRRRGAGLTDMRELFVLGVSALGAVVLSFGDWFELAGNRIPLPFSILRHHVPGFAGVRALSRFALPAQLALALFAAVGLQAIAGRRRARKRTALVAIVVVLVLAESAIPIQRARVPTTSDSGGIETALQRSPTGVVVELPIASSAQIGWIANEPSRQLLALHDTDPRVNGYSGFEPPGFIGEANVLNTFPSPHALSEARRLGVRYVVLRTRLIGEIEPVSIRHRLAVDGQGRFTDATAQKLIAALPPYAAASVRTFEGGYLVELKQ
jgi:hypothetical protein